MYSDFQWSVDATARNRLTQIYEPLQPFVLLEFSRTFDTDTFIDIGANIGVYSVFMSTLPQLDAIHAFEAAPSTYKLLYQTIADNELEDRVTCHSIALSNVAGKLDFGIVAELSGANSIVTTSIHDPEKFKDTLRVEAMPLDEVLSPTNRRLSIKVDVEGHEREVLRGAHGILSQNHVLLQIESYPDGDDKAIRYLLDLGFQEILRIGPDHYFTNAAADFDDRLIRVTLENALAEMIRSNLSLSSSEANRPVRRRLWGGIVIEVSGRPVAFARRWKQKIVG